MALRVVITLVVSVVALLASVLTFFSGFGLGTLLLPAFALFYPVEQAVALTAVVHLANGLFKLALLGRNVSFRIVLLFGLPALAAALAGAWVLRGLSQAGTAKLVVGALLLVFAVAELSPRFRALSFPPSYLPLGGVLSGFFGGLAGMQGALRSAFLAKAGLSKEQFIATGAALAVLIDLSRLTVYVPALSAARHVLAGPALYAALAAALLGTLVGNRYLKNVTMRSVQRAVAIMLVVVALGLMLGVL